MMTVPENYINHRLKPPKKFFDWCYTFFSKYEWVNKEKKIVSSSRENCDCVTKKLRKNSNLTFSLGFRSFLIILISRKRIEFQQYGFWGQIEDGVENITCELVNFEQFSNGEHVKVTNHYKEYRWGLSPMYGFMSGTYTGTTVYDNGWRNRLQSISELKYLKFEHVEFDEIAHIYKYRKEIEFAQKIHADKLASEIMHISYAYNGTTVLKNVDMRTVNQKWLQANKSFLKNSSFTFHDCVFEKKIKERNGKVVPGIRRYMTYHDVGKVPKKIGIVKFQNWVIKNEVNMRYYFDYLAILKELNIAMDSENVLLPKDLHVAHDNAVELLNQIEREIDEKLYNDRLEKILDYEAEVGEYVFLVPKDLNEIVQEGKNLSHCVGNSNYIENHKYGRTTIVFVRKKCEKDKAFYTLEYNKGHIVQLRGKHNKAPSEELEQATKKWVSLITKRKHSLHRAS